MTYHFTSRELNHDVAAAKRASRRGPVFITGRGKLAHVLLSYDEYRRLKGKGPSIGDLLSNPDVAAIDFDPPRLPDEEPQAAVFD